MMLIMMLTMLTSLSMLLMNHPISMGTMLLSQTLLISLKTGMMNSTFWFSYILFLVMIGGMLILFVYMTSVASNEKFKISQKIMILYLLIMIMSILMLKNENLNLLLKTKEMNLLDSNTLIMNMNLKYFSPFMSKIMISAMIYLLITLIMIVKITKKNKGPIRQKN